MQVLPVFLDENTATVAGAAAFHGVMDEIDIFAVAVIQINAVAAIDITNKIDDVVSDNHRLISSSHRRTGLENRCVIGVSRHVHHIVFDDAVIADAEQIHRMIVGQHIVCVVGDGVAAYDRIVGERDVNALERLVQESAILDQHAIVERIDVFTLIIEGDIAVFEVTSNELVVMANPFTTGIIYKVFVAVEVVV